MRILKLSILLAASLMAGCTVGPNYKPPRVTVLNEWGEQGREPTTRPGSEAAATRPSVTVSRDVPLVEWWTTFHDPQLDDLIRRAAGANLDLQRAESRVREARAQRAVVRSDLYPQIGTSGSYTHARASKNGLLSAFGSGGSGGGVNVGGGSSPPAGSNGSAAIPGSQFSEFDLYQVGFDATWELDVFGGTRRAVEAATAHVQAAIEDRHDVMLSLFGEVARNYIELRSLQRRLVIARENLDAQTRAWKLTSEQARQGLTNELDVSRARAQVSFTAAQIPTLESATSQAIHRLSILLDQRPTALGAELTAPKPVPPVPAEVPVGLPADLLRRRPDVRRAERNLAAATSNVGVATADLFPKISLTGSVGLQSTEPGNLFDYASRFYSLGPQVNLPIFDAGRRRGRLHVAQEQQQQAMLTFRQTVLGAMRDVEDALVTYGKVQERTKALADSAAANRQAVRIAQDQYSRGLVDFLSVLDAQRALYAAEDSLAASEADVSTTLVMLYKSLGGGWELSDAQPMPVAGTIAAEAGVAAPAAASGAK